MEPEVSLPYSQEPTICHYPEPDQLPSHLLQVPPIVLFPSRFPNKNIYVLYLSNTCYIPKTSPPSKFDHPRNILSGLKEKYINLQVT